MRVASSIPSVRERTKMAEKVHGLFVEKKKNTKSGVWQHFALKATENGSVTENEQDQPICRFCGKGILAKANNSTNLYQHLREHHPTVYAEVVLKPTVKPARKGESSTTQATLARNCSNKTTEAKGNYEIGMRD